MSVRRPRWVRALALDLLTMFDPVGAARVQMSRGALAPPEEPPSSWPQGESASGGASALSEEYTGGSTVRAHRGQHTEAADDGGVALSRGLMPRSVQGQRNTPSELAHSSLSALSGEDPAEARKPWNRRRPPIGPSNPGPSSPLSAPDHAAEPAWHPSPPTGGPAVRLVPGLGGRAQLLLFGGVFFGPALGWALGVIFGAEL